MGKYIKLKSVTWWSGVALAAVQVARALGIVIPESLDEVIIGIGAIGLRGAIKG